MNKEVFERYAAVKNKIKELTEEAKVIEGEVGAEMEKEDMKSLKSPIGTFSIILRKRWEYSPAVGLLEEKTKTLKKQEEKDGTAAATESTGLMFRARKEQENGN